MVDYCRTTRCCPCWDFYDLVAQTWTGGSPKIMQHIDFRRMNRKLDRDFKPLRKYQQKPISGKAIHNDHDVNLLRSKYSIEVDGENVPAPFEHFEDTKLPRRILNHLLHKKKFSKPTPIQMQALSCVINKRDVIGLSPTGSGKTYAYLLPLCLFLNESESNRVSNMIGNTEPYGLIIVPTRELVKQVGQLLEELLQLFCYSSEPCHSNISEVSDQTSHTFVQQMHSLPSYSNINSNYQASNNFPYSFANQPSNYYQQTASPQRPPFYQSISQNHVMTPNLQNSPLPIHCGLEGANGHDSKSNFVAQITGGVPIKDNLSQFNRKTKVVVSTPGRLLDIHDKNLLSLNGIQYSVFDECDRLLELGLEEQLRTIISIITLADRSPQVTMWSATLPQSLERLVRSAVIDLVYICAGIQDSVPLNIFQDVRFTHTYLKPSLLLDVVRQIPYPPVLIFTHSKGKADEVCALLFEEQFHVASIHSGKEQHVRNEIMEGFRNNEFDILVATDLISRGLDIPSVSHVINFETPDSIEDYIHRCGRTGRFGREGTATTFLTLECKIAKELREMLESTNNAIPSELCDFKMFGKKILKTEMGDRVIT